MRRRFRLRWAAYPSWVRIATAAEALVVAVIVLVAWRLVWYSGGDESAFDSAFEFSTGSPQLERALLTSWTWATQGGAPRSIRSLDYWRPYLEPSLPPALCMLSEPTRPALRDPIDELSRLTSRRSDPDRYEQYRDALTSLREIQPQNVEETFLRSYNLARAFLALGDAGQASEMIILGLLPLLDDGWLPIVRSSEEAIAAYATGGVADDRIVSAFLGRYLAGLVSLEYGHDPEGAIQQFRYSLNASNYLLRPEQVEEGNARRIVMPSAAYACDAGDPQEDGTTLDSYAGLVAAYLAAPDLREPPSSVERELRRGPPPPPGDPLRPVLLHGLTVARRPADGGGGRLPQNVIWAASNLQQVHRTNRANPEPRIEASRAALVLMILRTPEYRAAIGEQTELDVCRMLDTLEGGLSAPSVRAWARPELAMPIDSLIAAITLEVAALRGTECGESVRPHPAIQSALVRLSGTRIQQGLPGLFEVHRDSLETAFRAESRDRAQAVRAFRRALADVAEHSGGLTLSLSLSAQDPRARTREWMRAVWEDLAHHFHATLLTRPGNAREAGVQMETLHRLVLKAGIPPRNLYAYEDHLPRAQEAGGLSPFLYWLRFNLLSYPAWAFLGLFGLLSLAVLGWIAIVSLWRFQLITRSAYLASADGRR